MNTSHETIDSIEHSAYDHAMSGEVKEKWEEEFDEEWSKSQKWCGGKFGSLDEIYDHVEFIPEEEGIKDFIRTQRSLAQQEILDRMEEELSQRYEAGVRRGIDIGYDTTLYAFEGIIKKERDTWARESIGDKALQSLERALTEDGLSTPKDTNIW